MLRGVQMRSVYIYAAWFKASRILRNTCIDATGAADVVDPEDGDDRFLGLVFPSLSAIVKLQRAMSLMITYLQQ